MTSTPWNSRAGTAGRSSRTLAVAGRLRAGAVWWAVAGTFLLWVAMFILQRSYSFRLAQTLTLYRWPALRRFSDALTTDGFINTSWKSAEAGPHKLWYALAALALVGLWGWVLWLLRPGAYALPLRWILAAAGAFSAPLVFLSGMTSGDLYLYSFYGRILSKYGENPILVPPDAFPGDSHLPWVYWKWLPSAYGPVWTMLSGALSGMAGESVWPNVFAYRAAALALHLLATAAVWQLLRATRPELAAWGAVLYGWNPLVLYETVGSAHNEVLAALCVLLALLGAVTGRWLYAVFFVVAGALVKLTLLLFLPFLLLAWLRSLPDLRARARATLLAAAVGVVGGLALYAPLWGGMAMIENARGNPAAQRYQNTIWEWASLRLAPVGDTIALEAVQADLNPLRNGLLALALLVLARGAWRGWPLEAVWLGAWLAYCATSQYAWPWYFVLPIALAAASGSGRLAVLAGGLSVGGMLFWLGWPDPPLPAAPWVYHERAFLLFAPALLAGAVPLLRRLPRPSPLRRAEVAS